MRDRSTQEPGSPTSWGRFVPSARHFRATSPARSWPGSQVRTQCWVSPPIAYAVVGQLPNCVRNRGSASQLRTQNGPAGGLPSAGTSKTRGIVLRTQWGTRTSGRRPAGTSCVRCCGPGLGHVSQLRAHDRSAYAVVAPVAPHGILVGRIRRAGATFLPHETSSLGRRRVIHSVNPRRSRSWLVPYRERHGEQASGSAACAHLTRSRGFSRRVRR